MNIVRPHKVLQNAKSGVDALELTEGKFSGIIFSYGKVRFEENEAKDNLKIHFDYEIHDDRGKEYDKKEFEQELGDFIQELIAYGVQENNLVYTGGLDENRKDDNKQSDS